MGTSLLRKKDGSLDLFIHLYCHVGEILHDRDIFDMAFSGANEFTEVHARELMEMFADLYNLRLKKETTL